MNGIDTIYHGEEGDIWDVVRRVILELLGMGGLTVVTGFFFKMAILRYV